MTLQTFTSMQKAKAEQQFQGWYEEFSDPLFRFCFSKTSNRETALDLTQETFARLWDEVVKGKDIAHPRALLYTIARNLITDHYRKKKSDSLDTLLEAGAEFGLPARAEVDVAYSEALHAINELDEVYREAVYLRYVEELPPREIADITGESVNVISVRITRGMQQLREHLQTKKS